MGDSCLGYAEVTEYIRGLRGGSQAALVRASDGLLYVLKSSTSGQGPNLPFNECVGTEIYWACGLFVPPWRKLFVAKAFSGPTQGTWSMTAAGPSCLSPGLYFGSLVVGQGRKEPLEILGGNGHERVWNRRGFWLAWLIDICAEHCDNRQCVFVEISRNEFAAIFVDHGSLLGGGHGNCKPEILWSRHLDKRIYQVLRPKEFAVQLKLLRELDLGKIWEFAQALPEEWKTESASRGLSRCLDRLGSPALLAEIQESMFKLIMAVDASVLLPDSPPLVVPYPSHSCEGGPLPQPGCLFHKGWVAGNYGRAG